MCKTRLLTLLRNVKRFGFRRDLLYLCLTKEERAGYAVVFSSFFAKKPRNNGCFTSDIEKFISDIGKFISEVRFFFSEVGISETDIEKRNVKINFLLGCIFNISTIAKALWAVAYDGRRGTIEQVAQGGGISLWRVRESLRQSSGKITNFRLYIPSVSKKDRRKRMGSQKKIVISPQNRLGIGVLQESTH